jgi:hypothetical protein
MTIQNFTGPCVIVEQCIYKPEWNMWEKLIVVPAEQTAGVSDTWWNLYSYATVELAVSTHPEFTAIPDWETKVERELQLELGRPI